MKKKNLLVLGGKSDIGIETAKIFANADFNIQVAGRNMDQSKDEIIQKVNNPNVDYAFYELDILNQDSFPNFIKSLKKFPDVLLCSIGKLGDQKIDQRNPSSLSIILRTNFLGPSILLGLFANEFEKRKSGTIIGISSVAGERGRASNYIYGSAKAGFSSYLSGLRSRLSKYSVNVITIIPGFVNTKMTTNVPAPKFISLSPQKVAKKIFKAYKLKLSYSYVSIFWGLISKVLKMMPEFMFKKIKF